MSSVRILIVDDHEVVRQGLRLLLSTRLDWSVCGEAADGVEAVEKAKALRPDVVLMDLSMPRMSGMEATRIIRNEVPAVKVIIVSQNDPAVARIQGRQIGATALVPKMEIARALVPAIEDAVNDVQGREIAETQPPAMTALTSAAHEQSEHFSKQETLYEVIDALPAAIYTTDAEGRITHFNKAAAEFAGRMPALGADQWCVTWKLYYPDGRPMRHDECPMALTLRGEAIAPGTEAIAERPDGKRIWFIPYPKAMRNARGKVGGGINMLVDITAQKHTAQASNLLAAIVDSSDDAIVSKSLDGVITSWNKAAERLFGYTAQEAIGRHITTIVPPERRDEESQILERLGRGENVDHIETIRVRKDGTLIDVSCTISPVRDASGLIIGASNVARDITERKRANEALRKSEEQLRRLTETLDAEVREQTKELEQRNAELVWRAEQIRDLSLRLTQIQDDERRHIARELHDSAGQTLTVLGMYIAAIARKVRPEVRKEADEAQHLVQQLSQEIRTMSYLLHPPLLDEAGLSSALQWYVHGLGERSSLQIRLDVTDDFGRLSPGIELVVFRLIQECLTNIHRHSGSKTAWIRLSRKENLVSLEVRDQGKGMPPERLSAIQTQNSGVGIRGMHERVRQFNGEMKIESDRTGTRIVVTLPASIAGSSAERNPVRPSYFHGEPPALHENPHR